MNASMTEDGTLLAGVEYEGKTHKDFTLRVATMEDVEKAIEEAGPDAGNARIARHQWSHTMIRLGGIPREKITAELLAGMVAEEFGIIRHTEESLLKKLVASSVETSAASGK